MAEQDSIDVYVLDASSWISIEGHPAQNRILHSLIPLIEAGRIKSPPQVWDELKKCDWVLAWIGDYRSQIVENRDNDIDYLMLVGRVTREFPALAGARGSKNKADPYVVALTAYGNEMDNPNTWITVADETLESRPSKKIPTACDRFGVDCMSLMEMLAEEYPDEQ